MFVLGVHDHTIYNSTTYYHKIGNEPQPTHKSCSLEKKQAL